MRSIALTDLKDQLAECVAEARAGETLLVTEGDRIVAELVPPRSEHGRSADRVAEVNALRSAHGQPPLSPFQERGLREGWLTPATRFGPLPEPTYPRTLSLDQLMEDLAKDREDR